MQMDMGELPGEAARHLLPFELKESELEQLRDEVGGVAIIEAKRKGAQEREITCGHCGRVTAVLPQDEPRHEKGWRCPACGRPATAIKRRYAGEKHNDEGWVTVWRRSRADRDTLVAVSLWFGRAWSEARGMAPGELPGMEAVVCDVKLMPYKGGGKRWARNPFFYPRTSYRCQWNAMTNPYSEGTVYKWKSIGGFAVGAARRFMLRDGLSEMNGTRWERVANGFEKTWNGLDNGVRKLRRMASFPGGEMLLAQGMEDLLDEATDMCSTAAWAASGFRKDARTARAYLGLTRDDWSAVKGEGLKPGLLSLWLMRQARARGWRLKTREMCLTRQSGNDARAMADRILEGCERIAGMAPEGRTSPERVFRYLLSQGGSMTMTLRDMEDYRRECEALAYDPRDKALMWPADLSAAHREASQRMRYKLDTEMNEALTAFAGHLAADYGFRAAGLVLRPFRTAEEIIREGSEQGICIASYIKRYAMGETVLCALRREEEPDKPFHAVEFSPKTSEMIQCRGYHNATFPEDVEQVKAFWKAWDRAKGKGTVWHFREGEKRIA